MGTDGKVRRLGALPLPQVDSGGEGERQGGDVTHTGMKGTGWNDAVKAGWYRQVCAIRSTRQKMEGRMCERSVKIVRLSDDAILAQMEPRGTVDGKCDVVQVVGTTQGPIHGRVVSGVFGPPCSGKSRAQRTLGYSCDTDDTAVFGLHDFGALDGSLLARRRAGFLGHLFRLDEVFWFTNSRALPTKYRMPHIPRDELERRAWSRDGHVSDVIKEMWADDECHPVIASEFVARGPAERLYDVGELDRVILDVRRMHAKLLPNLPLFGPAKRPVDLEAALWCVCLLLGLYVTGEGQAYTLPVSLPSVEVADSVLKECRCCVALVQD